MPLFQSIQMAALIGLMLPAVAGHAQTCDPLSVPATTPSNQFIDHRDGTVTDKRTGLMWKRCSEGQSWDGNTCAGNATRYDDWQPVLHQAQTVNDAGGFAGHVDWRIPNTKELASLLEEQCRDPSINTEIFPATPSYWYWSASPATNATSAVSVDFKNGLINNWGGIFKPSIRLVRIGQ